MVLDVAKVVTKRKKKPIWELKEGNVKLQLWKNKNVKGTIFITGRFHVYSFPFTYYKKIDLKMNEIYRMGEIIRQMPEIKVEQKTKKGGKKDET